MLKVDMEYITMSLAIDDINRFLEAQQSPYCGYEVALGEIKSGKKRGHWIWYIFPQLRSLGRSRRAYYYGIADRAEAERYLNNPLLGERLREITVELLNHSDKMALDIFGEIDAVKVYSSMTMFDCLSPDDIFGRVLDLFYDGQRCQRMLSVML